MLVEFYAPWCGHCKSLAPEQKKLAKAFNGVVKIGAMDASNEQNGSVSQRQGVQGFPTIKLFVNGKPRDYQQARTSDAMSSFLLKELGDEVKARMKGKSSGGGAKNKSDETKKESKKKESSGGSASSDTEAVEMNDEQFKSHLKDSEMPLLLFFQAPWCGHCTALKPAWNQVSMAFRDRVSFVQIDATKDGSLAQEFSVTGQPTLFWQDAGDHSLNPATQNGPRDVSGMTQWLETKLREPANKKFTGGLKQLVSQKVFDADCKGSRACMVGFLPHIMDANAEERNKMVATLQEAASKVAVLGVRLIWSAAGDHPNLEQSVDAGGSGFPSLVAFNGKKLIQGKYTGSFSSRDISEWVQSAMLSGKGMAKLKKWPTIEEVEKWDGKDAVKQDDEIDPDLQDIIDSSSKKDL